MFFYNLKIFLLRLMGYEKPLRVALLKLLSLKYKTFRPQYETILLESCIEAKKLGYEEITVLELGVAGGNGIISLEKYKEAVPFYKKSLIINTNNSYAIYLLGQTYIFLGNKKEAKKQLKLLINLDEILFETLKLSFNEKFEL